MPRLIGTLEKADVSMLTLHRKRAYFCRYYGAFKANFLQQFVADELLQLPQVQDVSLHMVERFLSKVPQHKVTVLAFSASAKASIPLRHAVQQHSHFVTAGRVQWNDEVTKLILGLNPKPSVKDLSICALS